MTKHWHFPPEWHLQDFLWIGFPHDREEWPGFLEPAQQQIASLANAIADSGQEVRLITRSPANATRARVLCSARVRIETHCYGDIWLRDTGPLVQIGPMGSRRAARFAFNGWGGKYVMAGDQTIGEDLARHAGLDVVAADWVLEGGALDGDGSGLVVTTEQCLLNPNRNPSLSRHDIERNLARDLGLTRVLWLGEGLVNDHTDGHVDNLARFVSPGTLALPRPSGSDDPNITIYADAHERAAGAGLVLREVPSPGKIERNGRIEPASYMNFVITNHLVVVPTFGSRHDDDGIAAIAALFPTRETVGLRADAVLAGGGGFHCASQQMPHIIR